MVDELSVGEGGGVWSGEAGGVVDESEGGVDEASVGGVEVPATCPPCVPAGEAGPPDPLSPVGGVIITWLPELGATLKLDCEGVSCGCCTTNQLKLTSVVTGWETTMVKPVSATSLIANNTGVSMGEAIILGTLP